MTRYYEKDFQTVFNRWVKHRTNYSAAYELKVTSTGSIPFSAVQEHQENALRVARHGTFSFKIPDCGFQNPFDSFVLQKTPAFIVVAFNDNRRDFIMIDIDAWTKERRNSKRKSLTEERAKKIGILYNIPKRGGI